MRDIFRRIESIENTVRKVGCTCDEPVHKLAFVLIEDGWSAERAQLADESAWFTCPTHGHQPPSILMRLSPDDVRL